MARFCPLFSGSSGNSIYVGTAEHGLLVDAGASCKAILTALRSREISLDGLRGLFITHEHSDHIKGVRVLLKNTRLPLYATAETLDFLAGNGDLPADAELHCIDPHTPLEVGGIEVRPFPTSHDALSSVGYRFTLPDGRTAAIATDLGTVTEEVRAGVTGSDLVLLESNYDSAMLGCSRYPYYLKRRIASDHGHLSNDSCAEEAIRLVKNGTTRLVLGHLSRENNHPGLAAQTARAALQQAGMQEGQDYLLSVAKRSEPSDLLVF